MNNSILFIIPYDPDTGKLHPHAGKILEGCKEKFKAGLDFKICRVTEGSFNAGQNKDLYYNLNPWVRQNYIDLKEMINADHRISMALIQHDFDSYGNKSGEDLLLLLYSVNKPVVLIINKLPDEVEPRQQQLMKNLLSAATGFILTSEPDDIMLKDEYGFNQRMTIIDRNKILGMVHPTLSGPERLFATDDKVILEYAAVLKKYSKNKPLEFNIQGISLEILRETNLLFNRNLHKGQTNNPILLYVGIANVIFLYYKLTKIIYSQKMLESCLGEFSNYVGKIEEKTHKQYELTGKEEMAAADIFSVLGKMLSICIEAESPIPEKTYWDIEKTFHKIMNLLPGFISISAPAISVQGLYLYYQLSKKEVAKAKITAIADKLIEKYYFDIRLDESREWNKIFYHTSSPKLPVALLYAFMASGKEIYKIIALITMDWLISNLLHMGYLAPAGKSTNTANLFFGSRSSAITEIMSALHLFFEVFGDELYRGNLKTVFSWFNGNNSIRTSMYYPATGVCFDGIAGKNPIPGNETSAINYLASRLILELSNHKFTLDKRAKHKIYVNE